MSGFWRIDKSMGESRISQLFGVVIILGLAALIIWYDQIRSFVLTLI